MTVSPARASPPPGTIAYPGSTSRRATARTSRTSAATRGSLAPAPRPAMAADAASALRIRICAESRTAGVRVSR